MMGLESVGDCDCDCDCDCECECDCDCDYDCDIVRIGQSVEFDPSANGGGWHVRDVNSIFWNALP